MRLLFTMFLLLLAVCAHAATPHVWLDTDRGSIVLELDPARAPLTTTHFLAIVDEGFYNNLVFHRTIPNFVIQAGRVDANGNQRQRNTTVASESGNGLRNVPGTIALALPSANGQTNRNGGTTEFFINTATNSHLDADFTVFGRVVFGMRTVNAIGNGTTYSNSFPVRPALIRRAVKSDGFPIMNLHTGAWYDPAKGGRGISLEVAHAAGAEDGNPLLVVYWYDYFEGRQIWKTGAASFRYGDAEVSVPLTLTEGGQFGAAYQPSQVRPTQDFGRLTVRFSGCNAGVFRYTTGYGNGEMNLVRLTVPGGERCAD